MGRRQRPVTGLAADRTRTGRKDGRVVGKPTAQTLIDAMTDGLYVVDTQRRITQWNRSAERITGYSQTEAVARWCGDGLVNHLDRRRRDVQ